MDVAYVANLARIHLDPSEIERFQQQLDQVLDHVRALEGIDVSGVEPTAHAVPVHNVFRADVARPGLEREIALGNAPAQRHDLFLVPKILE